MNLGGTLNPKPPKPGGVWTSSHQTRRQTVNDVLTKLSNFAKACISPWSGRRALDVVDASLFKVGGFVLYGVEAEVTAR